MRGRVRCPALLVAVLVAVPVAWFQAVVTARVAGTVPTITSYAGPRIRFPSSIAAGPDGALWFTNLNSIGRISTSGTVTEYSGADISYPRHIISGTGGVLWFVNGRPDNNTAIARITTRGVVTNFAVPASLEPVDLTVGPDGALWFTTASIYVNGRPTGDVGSIGRMTTTGAVSDYRDPSIDNPTIITVGPDGALWFTNEYGGPGSLGSIGRITPAGIITNYSDPSIAQPLGIAAGPDGALWFANNDQNVSPDDHGSIGRITTTGTVTSYTDPTISGPAGITVGPDGALWFTNYSQLSSIGRITTTGTVTSYMDPSIVAPNAITTGSDGALWYADWGGSATDAHGSIGRITTDLTPAPWSIVKTPSLGTLSGVSCTSPTNCIAVGSGTSTDALSNTLVQHWDGTTWTTVPSPNPRPKAFQYVDAGLSGVSCTNASDCFAVGHSSLRNFSPESNTLVERWNGRRWSIVASPNPMHISNDSSLRSVSCTSATSCIAVGSSITQLSTNAATALVERWDGRRWSIVATPDPAAGAVSALNAVSCPSATNCIALGSSANSVGAASTMTLVERWNGLGWSIVSPPKATPGTVVSLSGVSCVTTTDCIVVGAAYVSARQRFATLVERWDGTGWSRVASPNRATAIYTGLDVVSCTSATACVAAGFSRVNPTDPDSTLMERYDGTRWSIDVSGDPGGAYPSLNGVSCATATQCMAVGDLAFLGEIDRVTFAEQYVR